MHRTLALAFSGLLFCVSLNAVIWLLTSTWFDLLWWTHLGALHLSYFLFRRYRLPQYCKAIQEEIIERRVKRLPAFWSQRLRFMAFFGIVVNCTCITLSAIAFAYGLYQSALSYGEGIVTASYLQSFLGILVANVILLPSEWLRIVQVRLERRFDGKQTGLYMPKTGKLLMIVAQCCLLPAMIMWMIGVFLIIKTVWWSNSIESTKTACYVFVSLVSAGIVFMSITDIGRRLCVSPVLDPNQVDWTDSTGLLLRSFRDEEKNYGEARENHVLVEMFLGTLILPEAKQWLAVTRPGEQLVSPGVQRVALRDDSWQNWVSEAICRSVAIGVFIGDTGGLQWELTQIFSNDEHIDKLRIFILPDDSPSDRDAFFNAIKRLNSELSMPTVSALNPEILVCKWNRGTPELEPVNFGGGFRAAVVRAGAGLRSNWYD